MRLIIEDLEGSTTVVPLGSEEVTIGRKEHNTIQLTEQNVSRSHAKLHFRDEGWIIEDLGSYNGVKVNGVPIAEPTALHESDLIQIGDYHLTLTDQVDRATVDIERPRAANDGMQPAMGSSSSDLPSMSVEDLEPMRPAPAGAAGPAGGAAALGYQQAPPAQDDDNKGKAGLIVGAVLGLIAIIVLAVWLANTGDKGETEVADSSAEQGKTPEADAGQAEADAGAAQADADAGAGADADAGALAEAGAETGEVLVEDTGTDTGGELIEDAAETGELIEDAGETGRPSRRSIPSPSPSPKTATSPSPSRSPSPTSTRPRPSRTPARP